MKVFFDIITNHTADVINYSEGQYTLPRTRPTTPTRTPRAPSSTTRRMPGKAGFPALDPDTSFPYHPVFTNPADATVKVPAWLNDRDQLPQPRRLDLRRRVLRVRRLRRARRPVHRAARRRAGHGGHLQGVGGLRRRRLPDRHRQARQHGVLAVVRPGDARAGQGERQRRLLHVRRGLRRAPVVHVASTRRRASCRRRSTSASRRSRSTGCRASRAPTCATSTPTTTTTPTPTPTPTSCRPSSATTTWAGSPCCSSGPSTDEADLMRAGQARRLADVPHPRPADHLLRRRAGLHRAPAATRTPGRTCSPPRPPSYADRAGPAATPSGAQGPVRHQRPALPAHQGARRRCGRPTRRSPTAPRCTATPAARPGIFAFSRIDKAQPRRVRRRAQQRDDAPSPPPSRPTATTSASPRSTAPRRRCARPRTAGSRVTVPAAVGLGVEGHLADGQAASPRRRST